MKTERLHPEAILKYWVHIEPVLTSALSHGAGETPIFEWFRYLINQPNNYHLWVVFHDEIPVNITLTKWNQYDTHLSLHVVLSSTTGDGTWADYKTAHHTIEAFAKEHGARRIEQWGRKGWERQLPKLLGECGERYTQTYTVMSMELTDGQNNTSTRH